MPKLILRLSIVLAAVGLGLAGCGSDKSDEATTAGPPVALSGSVNDGKTGDATSGSIDVELDDFYFGPAYIKAKPGQTVTLHLKNEGSNSHTFTSSALGVDKTLKAEETMDVQVTMPAGGATAFHCTFHQSQGMQGAFFFNAGDAVGAGGSAPASTSETPTTSDAYYN